MFFCITSGPILSCQFFRPTQLGSGLGLGLGVIICVIHNSNKQKILPQQIKKKQSRTFISWPYSSTKG